MLRRVREDLLMIKLRKMLRKEKQKHEDERDLQYIETLEQLLVQLERQFRERPKAR
jgi:hypothetical protein